MWSLPMTYGLGPVELLAYRYCYFKRMCLQRVEQAPCATPFFFQYVLV
jgi:hypothetical protein